jgi:RHH-type proline utilization regulon transcriptional repressor/proline dehydrogenase/delta 1-pyrroline-5-carboxylate dehydrogenase
VPPTVLEIGSLSELKQEVFGPVLHIVRYRRADLAKWSTRSTPPAYGLTLGVHSRIDETIDFITNARPRRQHLREPQHRRRRGRRAAVRRRRQIRHRPESRRSAVPEAPAAGAPPLLQHERQATPASTR